MISVIVSLLIGAFATSAAEYKFNYNLVDLIKDKLVALYSKLTGKAKAAEAAVKAVDKKL